LNSRKDVVGEPDGFVSWVLARQLRAPASLRNVAAALAERGYVASTGRPYEAAAVASMLGE
jgi:hypothetical protein